MKEIRLTISDRRATELEKIAAKLGKTLEQFLRDYIEDVPYGYTMKGEKLVIHEGQAKEVRAAFEKITKEPIMSKEEFDRVQDKIKNKPEG